MIVDHPREGFPVNAPWSWQQYKVAQCSGCGRVAEKFGETDAEAVAAAQSCSFQRVAGRWYCPSCPPGVPSGA